MVNPKIVKFREEIPTDNDFVRRVHIEAFGRENEADLVERLRENSSVLSFVAVAEGEIVGHILYSPVFLDTDREKKLQLLGLAPVAILPNYQRKGIGSALSQYSLTECFDRGFDAVFVLGHPEYYPRFGFSPASRKGFSCVYPVPDEVFMVLESREGCLDGFRGLIRYRSEFNAV
jgi:putative acetyltransferase